MKVSYQEIKNFISESKKNNQKMYVMKLADFIPKSERLHYISNPKFIEASKIKEHSLILGSDREKITYEIYDNELYQGFRVQNTVSDFVIATCRTDKQSIS